MIFFRLLFVLVNVPLQFCLFFTGLDGVFFRKPSAFVWCVCFLRGHKVAPIEWMSLN